MVQTRHAALSLISWCFQHAPDGLAGGGALEAEVGSHKTDKDESASVLVFGRRQTELWAVESPSVTSMRRLSRRTVSFS